MKMFSIIVKNVFIYCVKRIQLLCERDMYYCMKGYLIAYI